MLIRSPGFRIFLMLISVSQTVFADESLWLYAKGTDTRPAGSFELKLSDISRIGKGSGDYVFNDIRPEIEYGITDKLTVYGEVMIFDHHYEITDENLNPMFETQGGKGESFDKTQFGGFELGAKYNILSPYKDFMGYSLGFAYEYRGRYRLDGAPIRQHSYVITNYFQKNFLDDKLVIAVSPKVELERRKSTGVLEEEISLDVSAGIAYRVAPNWFVGLEFRHQSDYLNPQEDGEFDPDLQRSSWDGSDIRIGTQHQNGNYLGPTVHYTQRNWWVTAGLLFQVAGGGSTHSYKKDGMNFDEHEQLHAGITFAYEF